MGLETDSRATVSAVGHDDRPRIAVPKNSPEDVAIRQTAIRQRNNSPSAITTAAGSAAGAVAVVAAVGGVGGGQCCYCCCAPAGAV